MTAPLIGATTVSYAVCSRRRISQQRTTTVSANNRARFPRWEVERSDVQLAADGWILIEKHLNATVEDESVHLIGAHAATNIIRRFEHGYVNVLLMELSRADQPGQFTADDQYGHSLQRPLQAQRTTCVISERSAVTANQRRTPLVQSR